ncbi:iron complex outermembrane recepter protein [Marinomonas polaris DSM 16579]|uniref:Iron complex outermembrane recepter protein n=1 Tax=Marinomonas polaris DSM 16579 TaxID=1122206 RepID=A0A1M4YS01_9GAMM|nr:TonB-dependent receptor [Marinomonas polaris]SHF08565.1 iron complex outermembrane recepter protein [Marinomonas polaris DSM 16579]
MAAQREHFLKTHFLKSPFLKTPFLKTPFLKTKLHSAISAAIIGTSLIMSAGVSSFTMAENALQEETRQQIMIPAGELGKTLTDIAVRHHIALSFDPALTQGLKNEAVSGNFSPLELIDVLLQNTNLIMTPNQDGTYSLMDQSDYTMSGLAVSASQINDSILSEYKGGQIESGGRLGVFGEQDSSNVPFSLVSYTNKAIEDQQLESIAEVLDNDASVQSGHGYGNYSEKFMIRGFELDSDAISYGGLYGILPRQVVSTNAVESVQLLKGSSAFLNGVTPGGSGIGGAINLEPKRADDDLTALTLDTTAEGQFGISTDVARRFGSNNQWGVRVNALHRDGDSAIDNETREETSISVGVDYQSKKLNVSTDVGYQKQTIDSGRSIVHVNSSLTEVPTVPDAETNYAPSWANSELETLYGMVSANYKLNQDWTLNGAIGANKNKEYGDYSSPTVNSLNGDATGRRLSVPYESNTFSSSVSLLGDLTTGRVTHQLNLAYSGFVNKTYTAYTMSNPTYDTNIYNPVDIAYPDTVFADGNMGNPNIRSKTDTKGLSFADTLGFMDDRILLTAGVRYQEINVNNYNYDGSVDTTYDDSATSPIYGIVYKPTDTVSLYANHIEALQKGENVSTSSSNNYSNAGASLKPYTSEQNEVGIKFEDGTLGAGAALFEITKPEAYGEAGKAYGYYGEQRNRGLELSLYGEPLTGLRINTSATWLDPKLKDTQSGTNDGNDAVGVAKYRIVLGGEYDIRSLQGLTLGGKVIRSGPQYLNASNTLELDPWTRFDVNARYVSKIAQQDITWRLNITNLMNEGYWASAAGGYLTQGNPREIKLSVSTEF